MALKLSPLFVFSFESTNCKFSLFRDGFTNGFAGEIVNGLFLGQ